MNMFKKIVSASLLAAFAAGMTPLAAAKKNPLGVRKSPGKPAWPKRVQVLKEGPMADLIKQQLIALAAEAENNQYIAGATMNELLTALRQPGMNLGDVRAAIETFLANTEELAANVGPRTNLNKLRTALTEMLAAAAAVPGDVSAVAAGNPAEAVQNVQEAVATQVSRPLTEAEKQEIVREVLAQMSQQAEQRSFISRHPIITTAVVVALGIGITVAVIYFSPVIAGYLSSTSAAQWLCSTSAAELLCSVEPTTLSLCWRDPGICASRALLTVGGWLSLGKQG